MKMSILVKKAFFHTIVLALLALALRATSAQAATDGFATEVLMDNPIGYWRFNEPMGSTNAIDLSVNRLNGNYSTSGLLPGHVGAGGGDNGVFFDGLGNGRVSVPDDTSLNPTKITMEALVCWSSPNGFQQRIFEKSFQPSGTQAGYGLSVLDDGRVQVELKTGGGDSFITSSMSLTPLRSTHIVGTYDGNTISIYINGVLDSSTPAPSPGPIQYTSGRDLGIGNQNERDRPFKGLIDEAVLYDFALSKQRIEAHFSAAAITLDTIPLSIDSHGLIGNGEYPVHAFVPLPVGFPEELSAYSVYREEEQIPAQFETAATWPNGSPKVVHARFNASFSNGVFANHEVRFGQTQSQTPRQQLSVNDDETTITVDTGPLTFSVQRPFAGFSSIQYKGRTIAGGNGGPFCLDGRKIEWASQHDETGSLTIERQGPTCVTLKAEGWFQMPVSLHPDPKRKVSPFLRYCTRIYAYAGLPYIRIHHAITFAGRMSDRFIENLRFDIPIPFSDTSQWAYGADGVARVGDLGGGPLFVHQERYNTFRSFNRSDPQRNDAPDSVGQQADGWFALRNESTQIGILVKDFWEKFPNEVEIATNKIGLHTWPLHGHHHYTDAELYRYEHLHKFRWLHEGAILTTKLPPKAYEVFLGHWETDEARPQYALAGDAQGVSLTTEFALLFSDNNIPLESPTWTEQYPQWLDLFKSDRLALPSPTHIAASGIFGEHFAEVGNDFPQVEQAIERMAIGAMQEARWEDFGKFIYGNMHEHEYVGSYIRDANGVELEEPRPALHRVWGLHAHYPSEEYWPLIVRGNFQQVPGKHTDFVTRLRALVDNYASIYLCRFDDKRGYYERDFQFQPDKPQHLFHGVGRIWHVKGILPWGGRDYGIYTNDSDTGDDGHWVHPGLLLYAWLIDANDWAKDGYRLWVDHVSFHVSSGGYNKRDTVTSLVTAIQDYEYTHDPKLLKIIQELARNLRRGDIKDIADGPFWRPRWLSLVRRYDAAYDQYIEHQQQQGTATHTTGGYPDYQLDFRASYYRITGDIRPLQERLQGLIRLSEFGYQSEPDTPWWGFDAKPFFDRYLALQWPYVLSAFRNAGITGLPSTYQEMGGYPVGESRYNVNYDVVDRGLEVLVLKEHDNKWTLPLNFYSLGGGIGAISFGIYDTNGNEIEFIDRIDRLVEGTSTILRPSLMAAKHLDVEIPASDRGLHAMRFGSGGFTLYQPLTQWPECSVLKNHRVSTRGEHQEKVKHVTSCCRGYIVPLISDDFTLTFIADSIRYPIQVCLSDANGNCLVKNDMLKSRPTERTVVTIDQNRNPGPYWLDGNIRGEGDSKSWSIIVEGPQGVDRVALFGANLDHINQIKLALGD